MKTQKQLEKIYNITIKKNQWLSQDYYLGWSITAKDGVRIQPRWLGRTLREADETLELEIYPEIERPSAGPPRLGDQKKVAYQAFIPKWLAVKMDKERGNLTRGEFIAQWASDRGITK